MKNKFYLLFLLILTHLGIVLGGITYKYETCIITMFQNEADYLKEWIDYHRKIGFDHFILFNNYSTDDYKEVLQPYVDDKIIDLYDWTEPDFPKCQIRANQWGLNFLKNKAKWVALIDVDEFIVPKNTKNIKRFLKEYEPYAGIIINWQLFGTSDIATLPPKEPILKHLIYKFPTNFDDPEWNSNFFVKSIVQPNMVDERMIWGNFGNHVFKADRYHFMVDANKKPVLEPTAKHTAILVDKIQINHYWFRTIEWFYKNKICRRVAVGDVYTPQKIEYLFTAGKSEVDLAIFKLL